jgi:hypothetical protein
MLYPSEQAPFKIFFDDPGNWITYKAAFEYKEAEEREYSDHCTDLTVIIDIGRSIDDFLFNYQVTGEIENNGNSLCGPIWIIATINDENGKVVGQMK